MAVVADAVAIVAIAAIVVVVAVDVVEEEAGPMGPLLSPPSTSTTSLLSLRSHDHPDRCLSDRKNITTRIQRECANTSPFVASSFAYKSAPLHRLLCVPCFLLRLLYLSAWLWYNDANVYEVYDMMLPYATITSLYLRVCMCNW